MEKTAREGTQEPVKQEEHSQQQANMCAELHAQRADRVTAQQWRQRCYPRVTRESSQSRNENVEANDQVWEKILHVSAQDKSSLTTITNEKESCLSPKLTRWCMR